MKFIWFRVLALLAALALVSCGGGGGETATTGTYRVWGKVYAGEALVAAGRALADGLDCAYIADVAVRPDHQGQGLGKKVISELVRQASGHRKILLYANPGVEGFYASLGFLPMNTAMAIWSDPEQAIESGLLRRMD